MRLEGWVAAAGLTAILGATAVEAAPMVVPSIGSQAGTPQQASPGAELLLVRGGCGFGAHRTYGGRCHLNYGWRGRARAWRRWHRW